MRKYTILIVLLLLANLVFGQASILTIQGKVEVMRKDSDKWVKIEPASKLFEDDKIRTHKDSNVIILFPNDSRVTLHSNSIGIIKGNDIEVERGKVSAIKALFIGLYKFFTNKSANSVDGYVTTLGTRGKEEEAKPQFILISPRNTKLIELSKFVWQDPDESKNYELVIMEDKNKLWSYVTTDTQAVYPEDAPKLEPEKKYFWYVKSDDRTTEKVWFYIISQNTKNTLKDCIPQIKALELSESDTNFQIALLYEKEGLYDDAINEYLKSIKTDPENRISRMFLADLYLKIGLTTLAAEQFESVSEIK